MFDHILDAVGNTPLIRLNRLCEPEGAEIFVKYEGMNVGGSIKTRTALAMVQGALKEGKIKENTVLVEPTSGNQGVGLALVGAVLGIPVRILMPDSVSEERRKLMEHYGAEVVLVPDRGNIGECMEECIHLAKQMMEEDSNVFMPDQFSNPNNPMVQEECTAEEIWNQMEGLQVDGFCVGIGTGGTLTGVGRGLKKKNPAMKVWAVEPENAAILSGGESGSHVQMGIGDGLIPAVLDQKIYDEVITVSDEEAILTAKRLAKEEGILCGITGGTNVAAAIRMARELGAGKRVVTILPDTGERYFSTALFE